MKKGIHPVSYKTRVHCACGQVFPIISTKNDIQTEVCSLCHPYFTGEDRPILRRQQIDKFHRKWAK